MKIASSSTRMAPAPHLANAGPGASATPTKPSAAGDRLQLSAQARSGGHGPVPYINQLHPAGADAAYKNGFSNCAPTSMSMVARAFGKGAGLTDAQLITQMGHAGGTDPQKGSSPASVVAMAKSLGLQATVKGPGPDLTWINEQLDAGKLVIAHGNYFGLAPHDKEARTWAGGHFLVVAGRAANGDYELRDPLDATITSVTPANLAHFMSSHPSHGHQIAIGAAA